MLELIKYDVVNGTKTAHKDVAGMIFNSREEIEEFRKKVKLEHPDEEVYLAYKDMNSITKKETNGETEGTTT